MLIFNVSAYQLNTLPIWDKHNEQEQCLVQKTKYKKLLKEKGPALIDIMELPPLWPYLRMHNVVNFAKQGELKVDIISYDRITFSFLFVFCFFVY